MKKSSYNWIWKWHFIGGLVSFPVVCVLALTGIIYLFKDQYEAPRHAAIKEVEVRGDKIPYQQQWQIAQTHWDRPIHTMVIPESDNHTTAFTSGRFSGKSSLFINPYTGEVTGELVARKADMFKVRKLHGELLSGSIGTKVIELVGSWLIVLIVSGLFLFFPRKKKDWQQLFRIRLHHSRQVFFRDLHMVGGFWFSIVLLVILAGGMPWTDVWGAGFKWVQKQTNTGYPVTWQGRGLKSEPMGKPLTMDEVVAYAKNQDLAGEVQITVPKDAKGIFSIHNTHYSNQSTQVAIHLDQYTGEEILRLQWGDVGILMRARMWAMAFHQGQFGTWNWLLVLFTAFGLLVLSTSGIASYFLKRKPGVWAVPSEDSYQVAWGFYAFVIFMSLLLPLFGASVLFILLVEQLNKLRVKTLSKRTFTTN